jgi:hypothetical protein
MWFSHIADLRDGADELRRRRYGVIEVKAGRLTAVHLRPWPKLISLPEALWLSAWQRRALAGDRCWMYYDQPLLHSNFLALKYVLSSRDCTFATLKAAMTVLEEIARIKRTDAVLADVSSAKISDRLLAREGWQRHCQPSFRRHYIKRFYGEYASPEAAWALCGESKNTQGPKDPSTQLATA